eukprot:scaffold184317_cov14-Prasinocladus_malaysianus.AAC.1
MDSANFAWKQRCMYKSQATAWQNTTRATEQGVCDLTTSRYTGGRAVACLQVDRIGEVLRQGLRYGSWLTHLKMQRA